MRAAKKKELKRLPTPPRPKSPHTPPGPPPDPPPPPADPLSHGAEGEVGLDQFLGALALGGIPARTKVSPQGQSKRNTITGGGDGCSSSSCSPDAGLEEEARVKRSW